MLVSNIVTFFKAIPVVASRLARGAVVFILLSGSVLFIVFREDVQGSAITAGLPNIRILKR